MRCAWCGKDKADVHSFGRQHTPLCGTDAVLFAMLCELAAVSCKAAEEGVQRLRMDLRSSTNPGVLSDRFWTIMRCSIQNVPFSDMLSAVVSDEPKSVPFRRVPVSNN